MGWRRHLGLLVGIFAGANLALYLFVLSMNPYGNLPGVVLPRHVMTDDNQRYQYPSVVRSGRYDSLVIGTSTARLLDPRAFEAMLGGRFANVAMNAGTAWEQTQLANLFLRHAAKRHALVVGLDYVWCAEDADRERITFRGFPEWMYDDNPWNDLAYMYNTRAIEIAGRRLAAAVTSRKPRLPPDGYEVFTPPESAYDLAKVRLKLYGSGPHQPPPPQVPPATANDAERHAWRFPALLWLDDILGFGKWDRAVLVFPPVHLAAQPQPGSLRDLKEAECKALTARIGASWKAPVIDFRIASSITSRDENFWDPLHYRIGIAERVAKGIARALETGRDDPGGDWRILKTGS